MTANNYKLISYSNGIITYITEETAPSGILKTLSDRLCYRINRDGQEITNDPRLALQDLLKGETVYNAFSVDEGGPVRRVIEELNVELV